MLMTDFWAAAHHPVGELPSAPNLMFLIAFFAD